MPLYIRDDEVAQLARQLQHASKARTVTEAVRAALRHEIERTREDLPLSGRIEKALAIADAMGPTDPNFDMKAFTDEMWGDA